jgi:outer membrane murein-binding lipoprotein Lpp
MQMHLTVYPIQQDYSMASERVEKTIAFTAKYIVPALTVVAGLGVLWGVFVYTVRSEIQSAIVGMSTDVGTMKTQVATLQSDSGKTNEKIDNLLKEALERAFPNPSTTAKKAEIEEDFRHANSLIQLASSENIRLNPRLMADYGKQVSAISEAHSVPSLVWPAAATLINYRSKSSISNVEDLQESSLPNCAEHEPVPMQVADVTPMKALINFAYYENCRITLDSPTDDAKINSLVLGAAPGLEFKHCLVIYRGGNVNLVLRLHNLQRTINTISGKQIPVTFNSEHTLAFSNCLFDFNLDQEPPTQGREFTKGLLASNGADFSFAIKTS